MNLMLINVSTRKFGRAVRLPGGDVPAAKGDGRSKSAVSRRFVALSADHMAEWMASDLSSLDLLAIQIDGIHIKEELLLVAAVGIDAQGSKHPLGAIEGATESAATVQALLENLVDREGNTTDAVLPRLNRVSIAAALGGLVTPANQFCCDGGNAIVAFARKAGIPTHILPAPGKPNPQAPDFHINNVNAYHGRLKEWLRRFHGVATKNLPNYLGWRRTLEAMGQTASSAAMILGAIGLGPYQQKTL